MRQYLRVFSAFVGLDQRLRWGVLVGVGVAASALEAVGALLIFALIGLVTDPNTSIDVPLVGEVSADSLGTSRSTVLLWASAFVALFFGVRGAVTVAQTYLLHRIANNAGVRISHRIFDAYLRMPYIQHLQRNSAEMIRNAHQSVDIIARFFFVPVVTIASQALLITGIAMVLLITAPIATLLAAAVLTPLVYAILRVLRPKLEDLGTETQAMSKASLQAAQEGLHGIRDVVLFGRQREFVARFVTWRQRLARSYYLQATLAGLPRVLLETAFVLFILAFIAGTAVSTESIGGAFAILGLFGYAVLRLLPALSLVVTNVNYLQYGLPAAQDVRADLLTLEERWSSDIDVQRSGGLGAFEVEVRLENVTFSYPGTVQPALTDINLVISKGESIGVVGPTGGGKSTLIDILTGLLRPQAGTVTVDGVDIYTACATWQRKVGVVSQDLFLLDGTLRANIAFGVTPEDVDEASLTEALNISQLQDFVSSLPEGLDTLVGERGLRMSGGQRQRVAIARALYRRPALLVFDEGTSALDNATEAEVVRAIEQLPERTTVVHVAHRLTTVEKSDRIVVIAEARIVEEGAYDDLASRDTALRNLLQ